MPPQDVLYFIEFVKLVTFFFGAWYCIHGCSSVLVYRSQANPIVRQHSLMCFGLAAYCLVMTLMLAGQPDSDWTHALLPLAPVCASFAYYSYIRLMELHLNWTHPVVRWLRRGLLLSAVIWCLTTLQYYFGEESLFWVRNQEPNPGFVAAWMGIHQSPTPLGAITVALPQLACMLGLNIIYMVRLWRWHRTEVLLKIGIVMTFFTLINDVLAGIYPILFVWSVPVFYLGLFCEVLRFSKLFEDLHRRLHGAETELEKTVGIANIGYLAGSVCHDIVNHLGIVMGAARLTDLHLKKNAKQYPHSKELADYAHKMLEHGGNMEKIIHSYSLVFRSREADPPEYTRIESIVDQALTLSSERIKLRKVEKVELRLPPDLYLNVREADLILVLSNLLINACDALINAPEKHVSVVAGTRDDKAFFEVRDTGHGVPEEYRHRIFDPRFSTKERGSSSGMGLNIVQRIVESNGGSIAFNSGSGPTTFTATFPDWRQGDQRG